MLSNIFNADFQEFIHAINDCDVEYLLVGGYAVIAHGYSRTTGDMDLWINPTEANYKRLQTAFAQFGMPLFGMSEEKFLDTNQFDVFTFGRPPASIIILTKEKGLSFEAAFAHAQWHQIEADLEIRVIHLNDLVQAKMAAGRPKDLDDLLNLDKPGKAKDLL
jgi:hypothetical protein